MFTLISLTFAASAILTIISLMIVNTTWKSSKQSESRNASDFELTIERGACFGFCPVYSATVDAAGNVEYKGIDFVNTKGSVKYQIAASEVQKLIEAVKKIKFFDLRGSYVDPYITDIPSMEITVTALGVRKNVYVYSLDQDTDVQALVALGDLVDKVIQVEQYTKLDDPSIIKSPTIAQGIYGIVQKTGGNCMPTLYEMEPFIDDVPIENPCRTDRISATLVVRNAVSVNGTSVYSEEVKRVVSDTDGFYELELEPGVYSIFIEHEGEEVCTVSDGTNRCPVEVFAGEVSEYNPNLDLAVY